MKYFPSLSNMLSSTFNTRICELYKYTYRFVSSFILKGRVFVIFCLILKAKNLAWTCIPYHLAGKKEGGFLEQFQGQ